MSGPTSEATLRDLRRALGSWRGYRAGLIYTDRQRVAVYRRDDWCSVTLYDFGDALGSSSLSPAVVDRWVARFGARATLSEVHAALTAPHESCARSAGEPAIGESPMSSDEDSQAPSRGDAHCSDRTPEESPPQSGPRAGATPETGDDHDHGQTEASAPGPSGVEEDGDEPRPSDRGGRGPETGAGAGAEPSAGEAAAQRDGAGDASARPGAQSDGGDDPGRDASVVARPPTGGLSRNTPAHDRDEGGHVTSSQPDRSSAQGDGGQVFSDARRRVPIASHGGDTAPDWREVERAGRARRREARDVRRALEHIVRQRDLGAGEPSPRLDARRLVSELASRRCAIARCARRELETGLVLLACDVSGSCSAVCDETLAAAWALAQELPRVLVVRHSNGHVIDVVGQSARGLVVGEDSTISDVVRALRAPVAVTVAWGDWDAGEHYRELAARGELYWLDSYCATHGARPASRNLLAQASAWSRQPAGWWQGVGDAASTATALRAMTRTQRRRAK